ncbi:MAG: CotS family spore coat protein [Firmicutes bacterium]|nr:CotS family spore coat protein [Bacillota bacterium]
MSESALAVRDDIADVIEQFGLKLQSIQEIRKIWRIKTNAGYKYLKKSKLNPVELEFIFEVLEYLYFESFPGVLRMALSKNGLPFVEDRGELYVMTDWIFSREMDYGILMDLKQASRFLAEFHLKSQGFSPLVNLPARRLWLAWPEKMKLRLRQMNHFRELALAEQENSAFSRLYLSYFEYYRHQGEAAYQALLVSPYWEVATAAATVKSFCHHDYSGRNLLRAFDNRLFLIDFDYSLQDLRIHDLINLMVRNLKHNHWNSDLCRFILNEYHLVAPLTLEEFEVMQILLLWPHDFWQVGLQYYYEKLPWSKERFLKKLEGKIKDRLEREEFLRKFPQVKDVIM